MLDVPFSAEEESLARCRYEECAERRAATATTADEHARRADACVEVGTFALAFDTARDAHAAFRDAAESFLESVEARSADPTGLEYAALPLHAWRGTYAALLAGDSACCQAVADAMASADQAPDSTIPLDDHPFWYARAVSAAAAGDDETALDALENTNAGTQWAAGTTALLRGAVEADRDAVTTGLDAVLDQHRTRVEDTARRELHANVFAAEPTALTLLAWAHGVEYDPASRFVPASFLRETLETLQ